MTGSRQGSTLMRDRYVCGSRFTCTTNLTHGVGRSPPTRYGRHFWPRQQLTLPLQQCCCRLLFKFGHFDAIILRATLIVLHDPCRNHCGPVRAGKCICPCKIFYIFSPDLSIAKRVEMQFLTRIIYIMEEKLRKIVENEYFFALLLHTLLICAKICLYNDKIKKRRNP